VIIANGKMQSVSSSQSERMLLNKPSCVAEMMIVNRDDL